MSIIFSLSTWYSGPTLLDCIDNFRPPIRSIEKPFRMSISDIFKPISLTGFCCGGRIEAGFVQKEDKVLVQPLNELATVKNVVNDEQVSFLIDFYRLNLDFKCLSLD